MLLEIVIFTCMPLKYDATSVINVHDFIINRKRMNHFCG